LTAAEGRPLPLQNKAEPDGEMSVAALKLGGRAAYQRGKNRSCGRGGGKIFTLLF